MIVMAKLGTGLSEEVGKGGLIIAPGDSAALAAAMSTLANDPLRCRCLGDGARNIALARWNRATILRALNKSFRFSTATEEQIRSMGPQLVLQTIPFQTGLIWPSDTIPIKLMNALSQDKRRCRRPGRGTLWPAFSCYP
jgi:hypothetical protein